jgi:3D (Asp-Asp-Asp) domain-containing protein
LRRAAIHCFTAAILAVAALLLCGCGTTTSTRALPVYEPPLVKTDFQTVRTTAYTHTESDHLEYTNHNALGEELHAAGPPIHRAEVTRRALAVGAEEQSDYQRVSYSGGLQPFSLDDAPKPKRAENRTLKTRVLTKVVRGKRVVVAKSQPPRIGSAAADWSRWPAGTTFRLLSTGQIYRVDDYGWALSGRNTIDLYMATPVEMNSWGARDEQIQILQWGDPGESLRRLQPHTDYKHIRRMVLELEGRAQEAAAIQ